MKNILHSKTKNKIMLVNTGPAGASLVSSYVLATMFIYVTLMFYTGTGNNE